MTVMSTISRRRSDRARARLAFGAAPAALFLATAVGASCSDTTSANDGADASAEHNVTQPPGDDGLGPSDAATDSALGDAAGPDNAFPGVWTHAPGVPSYCDVRVAQDPSQLAFKWLPCSSGRAGCSVLDTSWTSLDGVVVGSSYGTQPARLVDGKGYMRIRRVFPKPGSPFSFTAYVDVLAPPDGPPVAAIGVQRVKNSAGQTPECPTQIYASDYGVGYITLAVDPNDLGDGAQLSQSDVNVFGWAPWSAVSTFTAKATNVVTDFGLYSHCSSFQNWVFGAESFWFSTMCPETVSLFDVTTQTGRVAQGRPPFESPVAVPGGAIAGDFSGTFAIAFIHDDGTSARLVTPTSPQAVTYRTVDRSASNQLVWVESDVGVDYTNATLWTSPFATAEAAVVRTKVAKLNDAMSRGGSQGVANAGVFFSLVGKNQALLTRLSDGMGWLIDGEPNEAITQPIWVDDNDVFFETNGLAPNGAYALPVSIRRLSRSTLGAPTVPSGL